MKKFFSLFLLLAFALPAFAADSDGECECGKDKDASCCVAEAATPPAPAEQPKSHPLKGVVMGLMLEKTALLVKHEEVPGVMRAMTMMFKVDPAVLQQVQRGDAITARMSRRDDGWWLTDVAVVPPAK